MEHLIERDKYFLFKEYPTKDNRVNRIVGKYAEIGDKQTVDFGYSQLYETTKTYNDSTDYFPYIFPDYITLYASIPLSDSEKGQYSNGFYGVVYGIKCYSYRISGSNDVVTVYWKKDTSSEDGYRWVSSLDEITEDDYIELFNVTAFPTQSNIIFCNTRTDKQTIVFEEYKILGLLQQFYYSNYRVRFYGAKYSMNYNNPFTFSAISSDGVIKEKEIQRHYLIQANATYDNNENIMSYYSRNVFNNYKNGRRVAELEWIGSPDLRISDTIKVIPKSGDYNGIWVSPYESSVSFIGSDVSSTKTVNLFVRGIKAGLRTRLQIQFYTGPSSSLINRVKVPIELPATVTIFNTGTTVTIHEPVEDNKLVLEYSEIDGSYVTIYSIQQYDISNVPISYTVMGKTCSFNGGYSEKLYLIEEDKNKTKQELEPAYYPKYELILQEYIENSDISLATDFELDSPLYLDYKLNSDGTITGLSSIGLSDIKVGTVFYRIKTSGINKYEALTTVSDMENGELKANLSIYTYGINEIYEE